MQHFDFNLLVTLDALLAECSVRGAAERMNVTAPAMSHALARLRTALGDPLLVRAGQRLVPTPRAVEMRERVRILVEEGRSIFQAKPNDGIGIIHRTLTIRANGNATSILAVALMRRVQSEAPGIQIRFTPEGEEDIGPLRDGSIDLDIGFVPEMGPEMIVERLFDDHFVGVVRAGHPLAAGAMTMQQYAAAEHVVASRRGRSLGPIDAVLDEAGLVRRVPIIVPDMLLALTIAAGSEYLATVPRSIAAWALKTINVAAVPLPFATQPIIVFQSWHPRMEHDPAHRWLRETVRKCAGRAISTIEIA